jgi:hypothetical protein
MVVLICTDLEQVVRELQHSRNGVTVITEDGCVYEANYVILSVSIGVLQSDLISFRPPLPVHFLFLYPFFICKVFHSQAFFIYFLFFMNTP